MARSRCTLAGCVSAFVLAAVSRASARQAETVSPIALEDDGFGPMDAAPRAVAGTSDGHFSIAWPPTKPVVIVNLTSITVHGDTSGRAGNWHVFPATFSSKNATVPQSTIKGTGKPTDKNITLSFAIKSVHDTVVIGMTFENVTASKQIMLKQFNVTYTAASHNGTNPNLGANPKALSGSASAVAKKLNDATTGLDLAAANDKSYLCDATLTYDLETDKSKPLHLSSIALVDVQAQAFVHTGKMDADDSSSVCPGSTSGNTTGVYIGAGIAAFALLFLIVFSCSNCSGNEESYRKLESHA